MLDTAVIPCGGLGTRLLPITRWFPKEMLPVGLKPLLYWTLDEVVGAGLRRAIVVTNPEKPVLESAAREYEGARSGAVELAFVPQDRPAGLGDALLRARDLLGGVPFAVVLPDNLFRGPNPTAAVLAAWGQLGFATVLIAEISSAEAGMKGATGKARVQRQGDGTLRVTDVADKGKGRFDTAGDEVAATPIGRFVFPGEIFGEFDAVARTLPAGAELDDVPVLQRLARRGELAGVANPARFYDVGVPEGYRQAVADFAAKV
jgi:UTP--glucose-1-phosphate uridylyltransferase